MTTKSEHTNLAKTLLISVLIATCAFFWDCPIGYAEAATAKDDPEQSDLYAQIGDDIITRQQLDIETQRAMRQRFYHFNPPEAERQAFRREVAGEVITRTLLLQEAARRDIEPDGSRIDVIIDGYAKRYENNPGWQQSGPQMLEALRVHLADKDQLRQLEEQVRALEPPNEQQLRRYYADHPDKFTEPSQRRLSLILLEIDPSSPTSAWQAASAEGGDLVSKIQEGADFAELARLHSADKSAENGGDMGYLHRGMLTEEAEVTIDELAVGEVSGPIRMLEGIAIFRLEARKPEQRHEFDTVRDRAGELWREQEGDRQLQALQRALRQSTPIEVFDPSLLPDYEISRSAAERNT